MSEGNHGAGVFVGRREELDRLAHIWGEVQAGNGRLVLIDGDAGIGKTRLCEEFLRGLDRKAAWASAFDDKTAPPFWLWMEVLRQLAEAIAPAADGPRGELAMAHRQVADLVPELAPKRRRRAREAPADPDHARFLMFDGIQQFLRAICQRHPLVIVFDDLHWADRDSLRLFEFIVRQLRAEPLLLIATHRAAGESVDDNFRRTLVDVARESSCARISLQGLDLDDVTEFVRRSTIRAPQAAVAIALHRRTEGNPLYLAEYVHSLASGDEFAERVDTEAPRLPTNLRAVIARRLVPLPAPSRQALAVASVLGQEFSAATVRALISPPSSQAPEEDDEPFGPALEARILRRSPAHRDDLRFTHGLIRDALYDGVPPSTRSRLHRDAAHLLARSDDPARAATIAFHFWEAGNEDDCGQVMAYARRAAEFAAQKLAYEEAVRLYELAYRAAKRWARATATDQCDVLLALGGAQRQAGQVDAAIDTFREAANLARQVGDGPRFAAAALGFRPLGVGHGAVDELQVALLQEAIERLPADDSAIRAQLLACLATALYSEAPAEQREALSRDAVAMARRVGDPNATAYALAARELALWSPEFMEERTQAADDHLQLARSLHNVEIARQARVWRLIGALERGDVLAADREIAAHRRLARDMRHHHAQWLSALWEPMRALLDGRVSEVEDLAAAALTLGSSIEPANAMAAYSAQLQLLRWEQGRLDELLPVVEQLAREDPRHEFQCLLAFIYAQCGRFDDGRLALDTVATRDFAALPRDLNWLAVMVLLAEACVVLGDRDRAATLYDRLRPYAGRNVVVSVGVACYGDVARHLAGLAMLLEQWDVAAEHLATAQQTHRRMRAPSWQARTQVDEAELCLRRGGTEGIPQARGLLQTAHPVAERLGLHQLERRIVRLSARLEERRGDVQVAVPPLAASHHALAGARTETALSLASPEENVFCREGTYWNLAHQGVQCRLKDLKGLRYLARLLREPGRELHVLDLVTQETAEARPPASAGLPTLDSVAKAQYKQRLEDLREQLDEAERFNDEGGATRARAEIEILTQQLAAAMGLGGRDRPVGSHAERARLLVTQRIKAAVRKISALHPALANHLSTTVRTGYFCAYLPTADSRVRWQVED